ncbi:MAG: protease inhibitor I42 family protein [Dehalococcoidales bacterium]|nr:MAG: protease inhibitor I42 family protein [Dehalococcoidales bacterium]
MKLKIIPILVAVTILLSLLACSQANSVSLEIPYDDFIVDKHFTWAVNTDIGDTITVTLGSNPTTGFTWPDIAQISNQDIVKQTDHKFISPEKTAVPDSSGKDMWTFKAKKTGTTTISMNYSLPWDGGEKSKWTFIATIIVR